MEVKKVVAIVRDSVLEKVEAALKSMGIAGISVSRVKGYGEYANFFKSDWMVKNVRLEIFTEESRVDSLVTAIMDAAHLGLGGDGFVAVLPVEKLYRIRTKSEAVSGEL